jgi:parallel beta-helix repeat protein
VTRARRRRGAEARSWPVVVVSLAVFVLLGSLSLILAAVGVRVVPEAATSSHGVSLLQAPRHAATILLPATARPVSPGQAPATLPEVSSAKETRLVAAEDARIRAVMHGAEHIAKPAVIPYQGARPTLVLPDGSRAYTAADLVHYGALVMLSGTTGLLTDNVFVASDAGLDLGSTAPGSNTLGTLYLDSTSSGSASIVTWGGGLSFTGTATQPLTIEGWDQTTSSAAADRGAGRPYIRDIGGVMTLADVRAAALGFWSGRTGGVAWTGVTGAASMGGATGSTFTGDTYGAFVARGQDVTFTADRFESNELDGLHIHRYSTGSRVTSSSAVRNGGNGFQIDRDTQNTVLRGDLSQHNGVNGYYVDGRPLVAGASASGGSAVPSTGTVLENSAATGNARTGILIEGGSGTLVKSDEVCAAITAIALRTGVTDAILTGNDIGCHPRSGLSVGPSAPGTVISGNTLSGARLGIVVRDSGRVTVDNNLVTGATVFGLTARGASSTINGVSNVISGTGVRAVDTRGGASTPALTRTDTSGWAHHAHVTFFSYLEFHPLAALWLGILVLVLLAAAWSYRRRLPNHPYPASTRWRGPGPAAAESSLAVDAGLARVMRQTGGRAASSRSHPDLTRPPTDVFSPRLVASRPQRPASPPAPAFPAPAFPAPAPASRPAPVTRPQPAVARSQPELTRPQSAVERSRVALTRPQRVVPPPPEPPRPQRLAASSPPEPTRVQAAVASPQAEVTRPQPVVRPQPLARAPQPEVTRPQPVVPLPRVIPWWAGPDYDDNEWLRPGGPDGSAQTRPTPKAAD